MLNHYLNIIKLLFFFLNLIKYLIRIYNLLNKNIKTNFKKINKNQRKIKK